MSPSPSRRLAVALVTACFVSLAGCGDASESPEDTGPTSAPESGTPSPQEPESSEPSQSEPAEPGSGEPEDLIPGVEPAEGEQVGLRSVRFRIPADLAVYQESAGLLDASDADAMVFLNVSDVAVTSGGSLDEQARAQREILRGSGTYERRPDLETPVCTMASFVGTSETDGSRAALATCEVADHTVILTATRIDGRPGAEKMLHSVLETLELR